MELTDFLEHHGVKGQKWGVRKDRGHEGERTKTKKIAKLDQKFARSLNHPSNSFNLQVKLHNRAALLTNKHDIDRINNKPQYKGQNFMRDSPLRQRYYKEHQNAYLDNLEKAAKELGTNASGTQKYVIRELPDNQWIVDISDVEHDDLASIRLKVNHDEKGYITSINVVTPLKQATPMLDFFEHHGVKGMHWGIRKDRSRVTKLPSSSDSKKISELRKRKPHQLTNKQLKDVNARLNMEQNFSKLNPSKVDRGHDRVRAYLALATTASTIYGLSQSPLGKRLIASGKASIQNEQVRQAAKTAAKTKVPFGFAAAR